MSSAPVIHPPDNPAPPSSAANQSEGKGSIVDAPGTTNGAPTKSLRHRALTGTVWSIGGFGFSQAVRLASNLILVRLLVPDDFGLMSLLGVFTMGLQMFSDIGVGPALIRSKRGDERVFVDTAFTIQVVRGLMLWLVGSALGWPLAQIYHEPRLIILMPVASFTSVLAGLNSTKVFTENRKLAMRHITFMHLLSQSITIVTMVVWAKAAPSVWALVAGNIVGSAAMMLLSHFLLPGPNNRLRFERAAFDELAHFGRWIFISTVLTFFAAQIDRLMLGKFVPLEVLGVYSIALTLAMMSRSVGGSVLNSIIYPVLAEKARLGREALEAALRRTRGTVMPVLLLSNLAVALGAAPFFDLLYPDKYAAAGWMARLVSLSMWFGILQEASDKVLLALGDSRALATTNLVKLVLTASAGAAGYHFWKVEGFLIGVAVGAASGHAMNLWALRRHGIRVVLADLKYTALFLAVLGVSALFDYFTWLPPHVPFHTLRPGTLFTSGLPYVLDGLMLAAIGAWAMLRFKRVVLKR